MSDTIETREGGRRLLVPMNVEALAVGKEPRDRYVDVTPEFHGIPRNRFLGKDLQRDEPCSTWRSKLHGPGIHLHWALPDGLTHGVTPKDGDAPEFPLIPNRWLVVRLWDQDTGAVRHKAWIVESDTIADDEEASILPTREGKRYCNVGRQFGLTEWPGEQHAPSVDITAIGYGDPAFAAYYPACKTVLGFHDDDLANISRATLTYFVAGWYSDVSKDPLHAAVTTNELPAKGLAEFLNQARWTYEGAEDTEDDALVDDLPSRILCHGIVSGIGWGAEESPDSGVPLGKEFRVSVGSTAAEAFAVLLKPEPGDEPALELLEALQYDLLNELGEPGGDHTLKHKLHERTFRPLTRGLRWELARDDAARFRESIERSTEESIFCVPGDVRVWLQALNECQDRVDRKKRELDSLKSELYATWYKKVLATRDSPADIEGPQRQQGRLQKEIEDRSNWISDAEKKRDDRSKKLEAELDALLPDCKLQEVDAPRFWRPQDPVVVLEGEAFQRSSRHGEDGRYRKDGLLPCRVSGQEVTRLTAEGATLGPDELDRYCNPFADTDTPALSPEIWDLFREALLLTADKERAESLAAARATQDKQREELSNAIEELGRKYHTGVLECAQEALENGGIPPSRLAINWWKGNPWFPLFLQWRVKWVPAYSHATEALQDWKLDGEGLGLGPKPGAGIADGRTCHYGGTTLLTPSAVWHFGDRLARYARTHNDPELDTLAQRIAAMSILCQSLGGLTEQLLMRKGLLELEPLEPGSDGDGGPGASPIADVVEDIEWLSPLTDSDAFFPLRAGHLKLDCLWVVDAFGQLLQLEEENASRLAVPRRPERLARPDGAIVLEPRLAQPARLNVQWHREAEHESPVCGWILPNFLDNGLMIYDATGNALAALQAVDTESWQPGAGGEAERVASFHWVDIPWSDRFQFGLDPETLVDPLGRDANPHLCGLLKGILSLKHGEGRQLLDTMSKAVSAGGGSAAAQNPDLALLIGRPLALVRASISLELDGLPSCAQGWDIPDGGETGGIESVKFPIRLGDRRKWHDVWLGDDGLVGFFLGGNYRQFYAAYGLGTEHDNGLRSYIQYQKEAQISIDEPLEVTLLMDPSRGCCATTGILPRTMLNLPHSDLAERLENKQVVFFTGPVVSPGGEAAIRMPQPSDIYGQWSWTHHPEVEVWDEGPVGDPQEEAEPFAQSLRIAEGWLKLITAPIEIRAFGVKGKQPVKEAQRPKTEDAAPEPAEFAVSAGEVVLSWAVTGAEAITLADASGVVLLKSANLPLPSQFRVRVEKETAFTLTASGRAEGRREGEPEPHAERRIRLRVQGAH